MNASARSRRSWIKHSTWHFQVQSQLHPCRFIDSYCRRRRGGTEPATRAFRGGDCACRCCRTQIAPLCDSTVHQSVGYFQLNCVINVVNASW